MALENLLRNNKERKSVKLAIYCIAILLIVKSFVVLFNI